MAEAIATAVDEVALTRAEEETAAEAATALVVARQRREPAPNATPDSDGGVGTTAADGDGCADSGGDSGGDGGGGGGGGGGACTGGGRPEAEAVAAVLSPCDGGGNGEEEGRRQCKETTGSRLRVRSFGAPL